LIAQILRLGELLGYDDYKYRKGSKVHVAVSRESLPLSIVVGPGDDSKQFTEVIDSIRVKQGIGRPKTRPKEVHVDSAYGTNRSYFKRRGIKAKIDINARLKLKRGRPWTQQRSIQMHEKAIEHFLA